MKEGEHFNIPETEEEMQKLWDEADILTPDMVPEWVGDNGENPEDYRYLFNASWAYVPSDEQDKYFEERDELDEVSIGGFSIVGDCDDGDGCVYHFYIRKN